MTYFSTRKASISLGRRALCSAGFLLCLSMATTNIVGAFATETAQSNQVVTVASDLKDVLGSGKGTVLVTVNSLDNKTQVLEDIKSELNLPAHDDFSELPVLAVDNFAVENIEKLTSIPDVTAVEPTREFSSKSVNYIEAVHASNVPTSPSNPAVLTGKGSTIGIIDSGINADHYQFANGSGSRVVSQGCVDQPDVEIAPCSKTPGKEAQLDCKSDSPACWHGHAVAGYAAGKYIALEASDNSKFEIQGTATEANISYFRIADSEANGPTNVSLLVGLNKFLSDVRNNPSVAPDVINISIGFKPGSTPSCEYFTNMKTAVDALVSAGVTVVVAAGNDGDKDQIASPACFSNVIAVGATEFEFDSTGKITGEHVATFSNSSPELDIVAPGTKLVASTPDEEYFYTSVSGTSFAAPIVAGAVALLHQAKPSLTPTQIRTLLINNADPVKDPGNGQSYPRLNVAKAVAAIETVPTTTTTATTSPSTSSSSPTTTSPATTVPTSTTRPVPGSTHSAQVSIGVSNDEILSGENVKVNVALTNNGTDAISNVATRIEVRGNSLKNVTTTTLEKDGKDVVVLEADISAMDLIYAGQKPSADATRELVNDIVAISCWDSNVCGEAKQNVTVLNAPPGYERHQISKGSSQTYQDTITNYGDETISDIVVTDAGLGILKFDKTTLKPGESATSEIKEVGANYAPGFWEIAITGTVAGRSGSLAKYRVDASDFPVGSATTAPANVSTTVPVSVAGQSVTKTSASGESLPFTGGSTSQLLFAAIWILMAGVMLLCFKEGMAKRALVRVTHHK